MCSSLLCYIGIGQIGKSFRNEISPGQFLFRTREFEQMELQYFCHPSDAERSYTYWTNYCHQWLIRYGLSPDRVRQRDHNEKELAHYAKAALDLEYHFPFGWGELWGISNRGDFDLKIHASNSGQNLSYVDPMTQEVIEITLNAIKFKYMFLLRPLLCFGNKTYCNKPFFGCLLCNNRRIIRT